MLLQEWDESDSYEFRRKESFLFDNIVLINLRFPPTRAKSMNLTWC